MVVTLGCDSRWDILFLAGGAAIKKTSTEENICFEFLFIVVGIW